jgi:hypothetical protein
MNPSAPARCVAGAECVSGFCVAAGQVGGPCRDHDPKGGCDAGAGCNASRRCVTGVKQGLPCNTMVSVCGMPNICLFGADGHGTCGPAGYTEQVVPQLAFVDACADGTHQVLKGTRESGHTLAGVTVPFAFQFFGSTYTTVWPSTRGALAFGTAPTLDIGVGSGYLPTPSYGPAAAPFWEQLFLKAAPASDICTKVVGAAPNRQFVVEWAHVGRVGRASVDLTFEVVLHETTQVVDLVYGSLTPGTGADADAPWADGGRAAIGLQSGPSGIAVRHDGTVYPGLGLRYTPK